MYIALVKDDCLFLKYTKALHEDVKEMYTYITNIVNILFFDHKVKILSITLVEQGSASHWRVARVL